jgi:hypothetical protein
MGGGGGDEFSYLIKLVMGWLFIGSCNLAA